MYMIVSGGIAQKMFSDLLEAQLWVMQYGPDKYSIVPLQ